MPETFLRALVATSAIVLTDSVFLQFFYYPTVSGDTPTNHETIVRNYLHLPVHPRLPRMRPTLAAQPCSLQRRHVDFVSAADAAGAV